MQKRLVSHNVSKWSSDFLHALSEVSKIQQELSVHILTESTRNNMISDYNDARLRLFLLDYDGTLVGFKGRPEKAGPDTETINLLQSLSSDSKNHVVIISGRDKTTLAKWLGDLNVALIAEHGAWTKQRGRDWQCTESLRNDWKDTIRPVLELYADRTPGSFVEEKDFSMVWHFRRTDTELAYVRRQELRGALLDLTSNLNVGVFEGSKILEIRNLGLNKGRAAEFWLEKKNWDFIFTAGDDYTDEDMFTVLPEKAYSIKVGLSISKARFNVDTVYDIRFLLKELSGD
jgi:trehalose 6-phosphate synthase/phosphatase